MIIHTLDTETTGLSPETDRVVELAAVQVWSAATSVPLWVVVLKAVGFGKHFGALWTEVPLDYLEWGARQDFDPDVKFTIKTEIARRRGAPKEANP